MGLIAPLWVQVPLGVPIPMKTFLIGDIHGNLNTIKTLLKEYAEKGDTLIQVGDFGAGRLHKKKIKSLDNKLSKANTLVTLVCRKGPIYFQKLNFNLTVLDLVRHFCSH